MLQHGIELQLMTRPRLVRRQSPGRGVVSEIIVLFSRGLAWPRRNVQRQNELALFTSVVHEGRRHHVWRRLLCRLGCGGDADTRRTVGQRHDPFIHNDLLNLFQALPVERKNGIAYQLLFLQIAYDVAIIKRGQITPPGKARSDGLHFSLDLDEGLMRYGGELIGRNVDAVVLHIERVMLSRQAEIVSRLGQEGRSHPRVVVRQLRFQFGKRFLPSSQLVLPQQRGDSFDVVGISRHLGFNLNLSRIDNSGLGHLFSDALLEDLGEGRVGRIQSGVSTDAGRRSEGVCSSSKTCTPLKTIWLAFRNGTSFARWKSCCRKFRSTLRIMICRSSATSCCCFSAAALFSLASTASVSFRSCFSSARVGCETLLSYWLNPCCVPASGWCLKTTSMSMLA